MAPGDYHAAHEGRSHGLLGQMLCIVHVGN